MFGLEIGIGNQYTLASGVCVCVCVRIWITQVTLSFARKKFLTFTNTGLTYIVVAVRSLSTATTGQLGSKACTCLSMAANLCVGIKGVQVVRNL